MLYIWQTYLFFFLINVITNYGVCSRNLKFYTQRYLCDMLRRKCNYATVIDIYLSSHTSIPRPIGQFFEINECFFMISNVPVSYNAQINCLFFLVCTTSHPIISNEADSKGSCVCCYLNPAIFSMLYQSCKCLLRRSDCLIVVPMVFYHRHAKLCSSHE